MTRMIHGMTGIEMLVAEERVPEFLAAGHRLAAVPAPEKKPKRRAKRDGRKLCDDRGSADAVEAAD